MPASNAGYKWQQNVAINIDNTRNLIELVILQAQKQIALNISNPTQAIIYCNEVVCNRHDVKKSVRSKNNATGSDASFPFPE